MANNALEAHYQELQVQSSITSDPSLNVTSSGRPETNTLSSAKGPLKGYQLIYVPQLGKVHRDRDHVYLP